MGCRYNYQGKEFKSKKELGDHLLALANNGELSGSAIAEVFTSKANINKSNNTSMFNGVGFNFNQSSLNNKLNMSDEEIVRFVETPTPLNESELNNVAKSWLSKLGINIGVLDKKGIDGMADILNNMLLLKNGYSNEEIAEEIGHFAVEYSDWKGIDYATFVRKSKEYSKYSEQYRDIYRAEGLSGAALEDKVDREILGKLIGKEILSRYDGKLYHSTLDKGFLATIKKFVDKFLNWLNGTKDVEAMLGRIVNDISNSDGSRFSKENVKYGSFYRVDSDALNAMMKDIQNHETHLINQIRAHGGSEAVVKQRLQNAAGIGKGDFSEASQYVATNLFQLKHILNTLTAKELDASMDIPIDIMADIIYYTDHGDEMMKLMQDAVNENLFQGVNESQKAAISKKIDEAKSMIGEVSKIGNKKFIIYASDKLRKLCELRGVSKETTDALVRDTTKSTIEDIYGLTRQILSLKDSGQNNDALSSLVYTITEEAKATIRDRFSKEHIYGLADGFYNKGFTYEASQALFEKHNDKKTGYILNANNFGKIREIEYAIVRNETKGLISEDQLSSIELAYEEIYNKYRSPQEVLDKSQQEVYYSAKRKADNILLVRKYVDEYYQDNESETIAAIKSLFPNKSEIEVDSLMREISNRISGLYTERAAIYERTAVNGKVNFNKLSKDDKIKLDMKNVGIKSYRTEYDESGNKKTGTALEIALVLKEKLKKYDKTLNPTAEDEVTKEEYLQFLNELNANGNSLDWLKSAGIVSYTDEFSNDLEDAISNLGGTYDLDKILEIKPRIDEFLKESYSIRTNEDVLNVINELKKIKNDINIYRSGGETKVKLMQQGTLDTLKRVHRLIQDINSTRENTDREALDELRKSYIPTDEFKKDYLFEQISDPNTSNESVSDRPKKESIIYSDEEGNNYKWSNSDKKYVPYKMTDMELSIKLKFEREHMEERRIGSTIIKKPNFYYMKMVNEREIEYFDGLDPFYGIKSPQEGTLYISKSNGDHYELSDGKFILAKKPDASAGEMYIKQGNVYHLVKVKPNHIWRDSKKSNQFLNPLFNEAFAKRGGQYKDSVDYNGESISTLNDEYFSFFGIDKANKYGEATKNIIAWQKRDQLLSKKEDSDRNDIDLPGKYYFLPQVRKQAAEVVRTLSSIKEWGNWAKSWWKRRFISNIQDVDIEDREASNSGLTLQRAKKRKQIPSNYIHKIDPEELSDDILYMYMNYGFMATEFHEKNKVISEIEALRLLLKNKTYRDGISGTNLNAYKFVEDFVEKELYAVHSFNLGSVKVGDHNYSLSKTIGTINSAYAMNSTGFNLWVAITGGLAGYVVRGKEFFVEQYFTKADYRYAQSEIDTMKALWDVPQNVNRHKILSMVNYFGLEDAHAVIQKSTLGKGANTAFNVLGSHSMMTAMDMSHKMSSAVLGALSVREINGQYYTYPSFMAEMIDNKKMPENEAKKLWDDNRHNSFFHKMQFSETGEISLPKDLKDNYLQTVSKYAQHLHTQVTGQMYEADKAMYLRNPLLKMLGLNRGFLYNIIAQRLKSKQFNTLTGAYEEGTYKVFVNHWREGVRMLIPLLKSAENSNLTHFERQQLKRVAIDTYMALALIALYLVMNGAADDGDEDDTMLQAGAYLSTRIYQESISGDPVSMLQAGWGTVSDPFSYAKKTISTSKDFFTFNEDVERGTFKGMGKKTHAFVAQLPVYNVLRTAYGSPKSGNDFRRRENFIIEYLLQDEAEE